MPDRYAIIGNPVGHSRSPWIHAEFARACRQDMEYGRIEAPVDGFARAVDEFRAAGGMGANVTLPFKEQAFRYAPLRSRRAQEVGVVNTLAFGGADVSGDTTDGIGLVRDLSGHLDFPLAGRDVLIMGAGGAAQGVIPALRAGGARAIMVANRTVARARALAERFDCDGGSYDQVAGRRFDLVVNATSAGLAGEAAELPQGLLHRNMLAYDMVYGRDTPFMAAARGAGARVSDGLGMLVEQAAESFEVWRGMRPETAGVLARLRAAL